MSAQYTLNAFGKKPQSHETGCHNPEMGLCIFSIYLIIGDGCHSENFEILKTTHTYPTK